jgi:predicted DNA-binding protein
MAANRALTLRLEPEDYERLDAEADRLGLAPATLARVYVRNALSHGKESEVVDRRERGTAALEALAALRDGLRHDGYPEVDSLVFLREAREELESR